MNCRNGKFTARRAHHWAIKKREVWATRRPLISATAGPVRMQQRARFSRTSGVCVSVFSAGAVPLPVFQWFLAGGSSVVLFGGGSCENDRAEWSPRHFGDCAVSWAAEAIIHNRQLNSSISREESRSSRLGTELCGVPFSSPWA